MSAGDPPEIANRNSSLFCTSYSSSGSISFSASDRCKRPHVMCVMSLRKRELCILVASLWFRQRERRKRKAFSVSAFFYPRKETSETVAHRVSKQSLLERKRHHGSWPFFLYCKQALWNLSTQLKSLCNLSIENSWLR